MDKLLYCDECGGEEPMYICECTRGYCVGCRHQILDKGCAYCFGEE